MALASPAPGRRGGEKKHLVIAVYVARDKDYFLLLFVINMVAVYAARDKDYDFLYTCYQHGRGVYSPWRREEELGGRG